jgi:hypothetical protein
VFVSFASVLRFTFSLQAHPKFRFTLRKSKNRFRTDNLNEKFALTLVAFFVLFTFYQFRIVMSDYSSNYNNSALQKARQVSQPKKSRKREVKRRKKSDESVEFVNKKRWKLWIGLREREVYTSGEGIDGFSRPNRQLKIVGTPPSWKFIFRLAHSFVRLKNYPSRSHRNSVLLAPVSFYRTRVEPNLNLCDFSWKFLFWSLLLGRCQTSNRRSRKQH